MKIHGQNKSAGQRAIDPDALSKAIKGQIESHLKPLQEHLAGMGADPDPGVTAVPYAGVTLAELQAALSRREAAAPANDQDRHRQEFWDRIARQNAAAVATTAANAATPPPPPAARQGTIVSHLGGGPEYEAARAKRLAAFAEFDACNPTSAKILQGLAASRPGQGPTKPAA